MFRRSTDAPDKTPPCLVCGAHADFDPGVLECDPSLPHCEEASDFLYDRTARTELQYPLRVGCQTQFCDAELALGEVRTLLETRLSCGSPDGPSFRFSSFAGGRDNKRQAKPGENNSASAAKSPLKLLWIAIEAAGNGNCHFSGKLRLLFNSPEWFLVDGSLKVVVAPFFAPATTSAPPIIVEHVPVNVCRELRIAPFPFSMHLIGEDGAAASQLAVGQQIRVRGPSATTRRSRKRCRTLSPAKL
jgi:hypothetical protein